MATQSLRLTSLPAALRDAGFTGQPCYRILRDLAIDGRFPSFQINGQWKFDESKIPVIASALGLDSPADRIA